MRMLLAAALTTSLVCGLTADDKKGVPVKWGGAESTTPAGWKEETPSNRMRQAQFKVGDAELALFESPGGGSVEANLERQVKKFALPADKKPAVTEVMVGKYKATYQDISGTYLKKFPPFDPNAKVTKVEDYRQIYVIFDGKDAVYSLTLIGPAKTIEKHKKEFDEWLKNFK